MLQLGPRTPWAEHCCHLGPVLSLPSSLPTRLQGNRLISCLRLQYRSVHFFLTLLPRTFFLLPLLLLCCPLRLLHELLFLLLFLPRATPRSFGLDCRPNELIFFWALVLGRLCCGGGDLNRQRVR